MFSSKLVAAVALFLASSTYASPIQGCAPSDELCGSFDGPTPAMPAARALPSNYKRDHPVNAHAHAHGNIDPTKSHSKRLTNAELLAQGLPPAAPHRRFNPDSTRVARQDPSAVPMTNKRGMIAIYETSDDLKIGYVSKNPIQNQDVRRDYDYDYGTLQYDTVDNAMVVDFSYPTSDPSPTQLTFSQENSGVGFTLVGMILGQYSDTADMAQGSSNYGNLGGVASTAPGALPADGDNSFSEATGVAERIEAAIWAYDSVSEAINLQWVNSDGTSPALQFWVQDNTSPDGSEIQFGGDANEFGMTYGIDIDPVYFMFEEIVPSANAIVVDI